MSGGQVDKTILSPSVHIHSWSQIESSVIGEGCDIGRRARIKNAILDKYVQVDPGVQIGYDHEEDRNRGFTVSPGGIVVVPKGVHVRA